MKMPEPFSIVQSLSGHDAGKLFMVVGAQGERLLLCDGKNRRLEDPKRKNPRHVRIAAAGATRPASDKELRHLLALAAEHAAAKEVRLLGER